MLTHARGGPTCTPPHRSTGSRGSRRFTAPERLLYEIYDSGREHLLIGYQRERAYLVDRGPRERCHATATHLLHFGGLPLIEYAPDIPAGLRRALSAVPPAHAAA